MGLPERAAGDHGAGPDLAQGERAGRDPDRLAAAGRPAQPAPGALDLRPGPIGRLHLRRRPAVGQGLARLAELRRVLVAGDPLVDAAGRPRQPHLERPPRRGADQGRRRRARQEQPVPQLPPDPGQRRQPRPEVVVGRAGPDRAGPIRGDDRERRGQRQLLREPRLSRARQGSGRDLLGRVGPLLRRVPRAAVEPDDARDAGHR